MSAVNYIVKGNETISWDPEKEWQSQFNEQLNKYLMQPRSRSKDHEAFALRLQAIRDQQTLVNVLTTRTGLKQRGGLFGLGKPSWLHAFCIEAIQQLNAAQCKEIQRSKQVIDKNKAKHAEAIAAKDSEIKKLTDQQEVNQTANLNLTADTRNQVAAVVRRHKELEGDIGALRTELSETKAKVTAQQSEIQSHVSEKGKLQAQVVGLDDKVKDLIGKLKKAQDSADTVPLYQSELATASEELVREKQIATDLVKRLAQSKLDNTNLKEENTKLRGAFNFILDWVDSFFSNISDVAPSQYLLKQQAPPLSSPATGSNSSDLLARLKDNTGILAKMAFWRGPEQEAAADPNDRVNAPELQ